MPGRMLMECVVGSPWCAQAEAMSQNMMEATSSALDGYLNRQPTIAIKQGSLVTIMVDRDLEIL